MRRCFGCGGPRRTIIVGANDGGRVIPKFTRVQQRRSRGELAGRLYYRHYHTWLRCGRTAKKLIPLPGCHSRYSLTLWTHADQDRNVAKLSGAKSVSGGAEMKPRLERLNRVRPKVGPCTGRTTARSAPNRLRACPP
jgi:hypothetical protein